MRYKRMRALLVLVVALSGLSPVAASATSESDVERAEAARAEAYQRLVDANAELDAALLEYHQINAELEELKHRISVVSERIDTHEEEVAGLNDRARDLVTEAYKNAGTDLFTIAFEAESIQDVLTSQVLIDRATDHDLVELDRLDAVRREMDRLKDELDVDQARVEELQTAAGEVVQRLDTIRAEIADEYARTDAAAREARIQFEEAERKRKLEEAAKKRGAGGGVGAIAGFVCPVPGSSFINDWGFPRSGGRTHKGTDMFASRGTPVLAVGNGTIRVKTNSLGGIVAYLTTGSAMYYYAHLDGYAGGITTGVSVKTGQTIGYVGNTGNAIGTVPHLHFQIHPGGGSPVNPYPTLAAAC